MPIIERSGKHRKLEFARNVSRLDEVRMTMEDSGKGTLYIREEGSLAHIGITQ